MTFSDKIQLCGSLRLSALAAMGMGVAVSVLSGTTMVHATGGASYNCTDLIGGVTHNSQSPYVDLVEGNVLTVTTTGSGVITGAVTINYGAGTHVFVVGPGQAGPWRFSNRSAEYQLTCSPSDPSAVGDAAAAGGSIMTSTATRVFSDGVHTTIADRFSGNGGSNNVSNTGNGITAYASTSGMKAPDVLMAYGDDDNIARLSTAEPSAWNAWLRGEGTGFADDGDTDIEGWAAQVVGGVDYRLAENVIVGLLFGYESADLEFDSDNSEFEGQGPSVGAYAGFQIADGIILDVTAAHSWLDYEVETGTGANGDFDASRWLFAANLVGQYHASHRVMLEPGVRIVYAIEDQDAFVLSDATPVSAQKISSGSASFGTKIYYNLAEDMPAGSRVWISLNGNYDFSDEEITSTTLPDFDGVFSGRVGAGLQTSIFDTASLSVSGEVSGLGSNEYLAYGGNLKVAVPLGGH